MKKIIALIAAGIMIFSLAACGQGQTNHSTPAGSDTATEKKEEEAETDPAAAVSSGETDQKEAAAETDAALSASSGETTAEDMIAEETSGGGTTYAASAEKPETIVSTDRELSNSLFSVTMPEDLAGTYVARISNGFIEICEKKSFDGGHGGRAFTIHVSSLPGVGSHQPAIRKFGELTAEDGTVYDIIVTWPTDVQYDPKEQESYSKVRGSMEQVLESLKGVRQAVYTAGAGLKGEDLYKDVLTKYVTALNEKWSAVRLEEEGMSPAYDLAIKIYGDDVLERIGYAYKDITGEGIDELLVGEVSGEDGRSIIYDIYAIEDHSPVHVLSGSNENRYYLEGSYLSNEYTGPDGEEYIFFKDNDFLLGYGRMETIAGGVGEFKIDRQANAEQPWFVEGYIDGSWDWENVTEKKYQETYSRYIDEDFTLEFSPFSVVVFSK